jgi:hypothetical protein
MRHKQLAAHPDVTVAGRRATQQIGFMAVVALGHLQSNLRTTTEITCHVLPATNPLAFNDARGRTRNGQAGIDLRANIDQAESAMKPGNQRWPAYPTAHPVRHAMIATRHAQKTAADQYSGSLHR